MAYSARFPQPEQKVSWLINRPQFVQYVPMLISLVLFGIADIRSLRYEHCVNKTIITYQLAYFYYDIYVVNNVAFCLRYQYIYLTDNSLYNSMTISGGYVYGDNAYKEEKHV